MTLQSWQGMDHRAAASLCPSTTSARISSPSCWAKAAFVRPGHPFMGHLRVVDRKGAINSSAGGKVRSEETPWRREAVYAPCISAPPGSAVGVHTCRCVGERCLALRWVWSWADLKGCLLAGTRCTPGMFSHCGTTPGHFCFVGSPQRKELSRGDCFEAKILIFPRDLTPKKTPTSPFMRTALA